MTELLQLPEPPRLVRWSTCLRRRWILGLLGGILALIGILLPLIFWGISLGGLPFHDLALDSSSEKATGEITAVDTTSARSSGHAVLRLHYQFQSSDGQQHQGQSLDARGEQLAVGDACEVEHLPGKPDVNRVVGTKRSLMGSWGTSFIGLCFLPGLVLIGLWFRGAWRLRLILRHGRQTSAEILEFQRVGGVNPPPIRVDFQFQDGEGKTQQSRHWVGLRSELGQAIANGQRQCLLVHDEVEPEWCRLVQPEDFGA